MNTLSFGSLSDTVPIHHIHLANCERMLFSTIKYHISSSVSPHRKLELTSVLDANGAHGVPLTEATHIISDSTEFEGWQDVNPNVAVVSVSLRSFKGHR